MYYLYKRVKTFVSFHLFYFNSVHVFKWWYLPIYCFGYNQTMLNASLKSMYSSPTHIYMSNIIPWIKLCGFTSKLIWHCLLSWLSWNISKHNESWSFLSYQTLHYISNNLALDFDTKLIFVLTFCNSTLLVKCYIVRFYFIFFYFC